MGFCKHGNELFEFQKRLGIFQVVKQLLDSHERVYSTELFS